VTLDKSLFRKHIPLCMKDCRVTQRSLLYPGCKNSLTLLPVVLSLVNVKARYRWSDKNFTSLLLVVHDLLPKENTLPKSYY